MIISPIQIKMARAAIGMPQIELADKTGVHVRTIKKIERSEEEFRATKFSTLESIENVFISKGVELIEPDQRGKLDGIGIRYYPSRTKK